MADYMDMAADAFAALSAFYLSDGTLGDTLVQVAELACRAAPADHAGVTLLVEGRIRTGVFTDPSVAKIDEAQYKTGQGPCLDAFRHDEVYVIDSTAADGRWPEFARTAAQHGIAATMSLPIVARGEVMGALNLYSRYPENFDVAAVERTQTFAEHAAVVLANAKVYEDARALSEGLNQAMKTRATIEHAVGILMAPGGRSADEAFQVLVRASQRENRKLRDIAAEIVERTVQRVGPDDPDLSTA